MQYMPAVLLAQPDNLNILDRPDRGLVDAGDDEIRQRPSLKLGRALKEGLLVTGDPCFEALASELRAFGNRLTFRPVRQHCLLVRRGVLYGGGRTFQEVIERRSGAG